MVLVVPEQSQRPYRFGMTLLCVGALFNWLGLADTYSDPVPAIRYIGVGLIAAGASLICMAMCFWMRNIHDPNGSGDYNVSPDPIHVISSDPSLEKPPEYSAVVDFPPCYEDAIKLNSTPIVYRLKQALSANMHVLSQNLPDTGGDISPSSKNNNAQSDSSQHVETRASDCVDFCVTTSTNQTQVGKSAETSSQNSSQNENTFAKVFRKSIRGIRRLRSGSEDSISSNSTGQPSNLECGHQLPERTFDESAKIDR